MKTRHSTKVKEPASRTWSDASICGNQFFISGSRRSTGSTTGTHFGS